jgi:threonine aldolase
MSMRGASPKVSADCRVWCSIRRPSRQNIVIFELNGTVDAAQLLASLLAHGVRMGAMGPKTVRAVIHLDVGTPQIERALEAAATALKEGDEHF